MSAESRYQKLRSHLHYLNLAAAASRSPAPPRMWADIPAASAGWIPGIRSRASGGRPGTSAAWPTTSQCPPTPPTLGLWPC
jgi:hypothetical protein